MTIKVRILVDTYIAEKAYRCNDVAEIDDVSASDAIASGWADPAPEAIAYAESIATQPE